MSAPFLLTAPPYVSSLVTLSSLASISAIFWFVTAVPPSPSAPSPLLPKSWVVKGRQGGGVRVIRCGAEGYR